LVPATAVVTDDHNTTHIGMLRFGDCDTRVISEDNAKTSYKRKNPNLTLLLNLVVRVITVQILTDAVMCKRSIRTG